MSEQSYLEAIQDEGGEEYEVGGMEMLYYSEVALVVSSGWLFTSATSE